MGTCMSSVQKQKITRLLNDYCGGDREAVDRLVPIVYEELQRIAHRHLQKERSGHTLNTTALVHEAYLKLISREGMHWKNRAHFFAIASRSMRHILVDYARKRKAAKRGGGVPPLSLNDLTNVISDEYLDQYIALDEALDKLTRYDELKTKIIEYQFFGGLTVDETAAVLNISKAKVKRDRSFAKAWLYREMHIQNQS